MSRKAFHISVDFDVHAVTCPGVWLCPKGLVMLRVAMFGLSENTKTLRPCFPLLFHERFRFRKVLKSVHSLICLQEVLKCRNLHMQLVHLTNSQNSCSATVLATFKSSLVDVFYPSPGNRGLNVGVDVDLLLSPTPAFPGIISPKVEISTRVIIEEVLNYASPQEESWIVNPVTVISSKKPEGGKSEEVNRQRAVCHTEGAAGFNDCDCHVCSCYNKKNNGYCIGQPIVEKQQKRPFVTGSFKMRDKRGSMHESKLNKIQTSKAKKGVRPKIQCRTGDKLNKDKTPELFSHPQPCNCYTLKKTDGSTACDCLLCKKYSDYFQKKNTVKIAFCDDDTCCASPRVNMREKPGLKQKKKNVVQVKRRAPSRLGEHKHKFKEGTSKQPFKSSFTKPQATKFTTVQKLSPCGSSNVCCNVPDCRCEERCLPVFESDAFRKPDICDENCRCKLRSDAVVDKQKDENCKCGIYSCTDRQRTSKVCSPPAANPGVTKCVIPQRRTHRQIFYSNLEDYYRKLYDRARERSALETIQACA